jgi:hypothetical protein
VNLEFFPDGNWQGGPLLLLYGGPRTEIPLLQEVFRSLVAELGRRVSIDTLPFIQVIDSCRLTAVSDKADRGVVTLAPSVFEWRLSPSAWEWVVELLQPFNDEPTGGFQFLNEAQGVVVIYSRGRYW